MSSAYRMTYPFTHWEGPNWPEIGAMLRLGLPIGVTHFAEVSAFGIVSLLPVELILQVGSGAGFAMENDGSPWVAVPGSWMCRSRAALL